MAKEKKAPAFSSLCNGIAVGMAAESMMAASPLPAPSPAIANAWSLLSSPEGIARSGLTNIDGKGFFLLQQHVSAQVAPTYSNSNLAILAQGVLDLARDIRSSAAKPEFLEAAASYSTLVAFPSSDTVLSYPAMNLGLKSYSSTTAGVTSPALGGSLLEAAGALDTLRASYVGADYGLISSQLGIPPSSSHFHSDALRLAALQASGARSDSAASLPADFHLSAGILGPVSFRGDDVLPSTAALVEALQAAVDAKVAPWKLFDNSQSRSVTKMAANAISRLGLAGWHCLAASMDPTLESRSTLGRKLLSLSLLSTHTATEERPAGPRPTQFEWTSPDCPLILAFHERMIGSDHPRTAEFESRLEHARRHSSSPNTNVARDVSILMHFANDGDGLSPDVVARAVEISSMPPAMIKSTFGALLSSRGLPFPEAKERRSRLALAQLSPVLAAKNPRIGLAQWARSCCDEIRSFHLQGARFAIRPEDRARAGALLDALEDFSLALAESCNEFAKVAVVAGQSVEAEWVAKTEFAQAWLQAASTGKLTARSIAWAQANPIAPLSSANPRMLQLAMSGARALGLPTDNPDALIDAFRVELLEVGLDDAGFALLNDAGAEPLRARLSDIFMELARKRKNLAAPATALFCACHAISAWARAGAEPSSAEAFVAAISPRSGQAFATSALGDVMGRALISTPREADVFIERILAQGKAQPQLYEVFVRDWLDTIAGLKLYGESDREAVLAAQARLEFFANHLPNSADVDWASADFPNRSAWEMYRYPSPRLSSVFKAAAAEGGLAEWCSRIAPMLSILDAADSNALIGQCKSIVKQQMSLSDAAWKAIIKSPDGLAFIEKNLLQWNCRVYPTVFLGLLAPLSSTAAPGDIQGYPTSLARIGSFLSLASARGVDSDTARKVAAVVEARGSIGLLGSPVVDPARVDSADSARFHRDESLARNLRHPRLFVEACKRFERLDAIYARAVAEGGELPLAADKALQGEFHDLEDFIKGSGLGIWQQIPESCTWGQLSRMSKSWHDEILAKAREEASIAEAKLQADTAKAMFESRLNPYAARPTIHWEPILNAHERDGWQAQELTSQSALAEEGREMGHCVSSYADDCRKGHMRIFSITLNGERKATLELRPQDGLPLSRQRSEPSFQIHQNKGRHNAAITNAATLKFCSEVCSAAEASWGARWEAIEALRKADADRLAKEREASFPHIKGPTP